MRASVVFVIYCSGTYNSNSSMHKKSKTRHGHGKTIPFITIHYNNQPVFLDVFWEKVLVSQLKD